MITCSNCQYDNPDTAQLCAGCGQPLKATQVVSVVGSPQLPPVLTMIGSVPVASAPLGASLMKLVPLDPNGREVTDPSLMIDVPQPDDSVLMGWNYYGDPNSPNDPKSKPSLVNHDLTQLYPWVTRPGVTSSGKPAVDVAVSKRAAVMRTDQEGFSFLLTHEDMRTQVWANPYGPDMLLIPPGFEIPLVPGMLIFMGKQQIGVTFIVREI